MASLRARFSIATHGRLLQSIRNRLDDPGMRIGHYRIVRKLAEGGMGVLYVAEHAYLEQQVVRKTLRPETHRYSEIAERFLREAQALAVLNGWLCGWG